MLLQIQVYFKFLSENFSRTSCLYELNLFRLAFSPFSSHALLNAHELLLEDGKLLCNWQEEENGQIEIPVRLNDDGWLVAGPDQKLLLWIPPEYRHKLMFPRCQLLISNGQPVSIDLSQFVHGTSWTECFTGKFLNSKYFSKVSILMLCRPPEIVDRCDPDK